VIVDAHPKEFIGVKLHQTVFLTGLDKIYRYSLHCTTKGALDKGLAPLIPPNIYEGKNDQKNNTIW